MKSTLRHINRNCLKSTRQLLNGSNIQKHNNSLITHSKHFLTAQSVRLNEYGDSSILKLEKENFEALKDGEILIENRYAGLNFIDTYQRSGLYKVPLPATLGMDGAGVIKETTPLAESEYNLKVGDRVSYYELGSYSTHKILNGSKAIPLPDNIEFDVAAACVVQGLTAHYLTRSTYCLQPGDWCVVHAAAGGVGQFLIQIAKHVGANVIGTTSCKEKSSIAYSLGCDHVVHYHDLEDAVKEITNGKGVNVSYDGVGLSTYETSIKVLKTRGYCVIFGNASGVVPPIDPLKLMAQGSVFLTRPNLKDHTLTREETLWRSGEINEWIANGNIQVTIDKIFPLSEVSNAHEYIESGQTTGKVVFDCKQA